MNNYPEELMRYGANGDSSGEQSYTLTFNSGDVSGKFTDSTGTEIKSVTLLATYGNPIVTEVNENYIVIEELLDDSTSTKEYKITFSPNKLPEHCKGINFTNWKLGENVVEVNTQISSTTTLSYNSKYKYYRKVLLINNGDNHGEFTKDTLWFDCDDDTLILPEHSTEQILTISIIHDYESSHSAVIDSAFFTPYRDYKINYVNYDVTEEKHDDDPNNPYTIVDINANSVLNPTYTLTLAKAGSAGELGHFELNGVPITEYSGLYEGSTYSVNDKFVTISLPESGSVITIKFVYVNQPSATIINEWDIVENLNYEIREDKTITLTSDYHYPEDYRTISFKIKDGSVDGAWFENDTEVTEIKMLANSTIKTNLDDTGNSTQIILTGYTQESTTEPITKTITFKPVEQDVDHYISKTSVEDMDPEPIGGVLGYDTIINAYAEAKFKTYKITLNDIDNGKWDVKTVTINSGSKCTIETGKDFINLSIDNVKQAKLTYTGTKTGYSSVMSYETDGVDLTAVRNDFTVTPIVNWEPVEITIDAGTSPETIGIPQSELDKLPTLYYETYIRLVDGDGTNKVYFYLYKNIDSNTEVQVATINTTYDYLVYTTEEGTKVKYTTRHYYLNGNELSTLKGVLLSANSNLITMDESSYYKGYAPQGSRIIALVANPGERPNNTNVTYTYNEDIDYEETQYKWFIVQEADTNGKYYTQINAKLDRPGISLTTEETDTIVKKTDDDSSEIVDPDPEQSEEDLTAISETYEDEHSQDQLATAIPSEDTLTVEFANIVSQLEAEEGE